MLTTENISIFLLSSETPHSFIYSRLTILKTSKLLAFLLFTAISIFCTTTSATATIPTNEVTPNGNNKIAGFGDAKDAGDAFGQPIREMADPYFDNVWYASLYDWVKQDIDNKYYDGSLRHDEYVQVCRTIAENQDLLRNWGDSILEPWSNQLNLSVREQNGVVHCYLRVLSQN
jgi:hypothetical protein